MFNATLIVIGMSALCQKRTKCDAAKRAVLWRPFLTMLAIRASPDSILARRESAQPHLR